MLHQMQKKQELAKRNAKLKEQIHRQNRKKGKGNSQRQVAHQKVTNINCPYIVEQKNEVRPWDVENGVQNHFADII